MTRPLTYIERAAFLAAVKDIGEGDEIADATLDLIIEMTAGTSAPWADTDPLAAERWLVAQGATPERALANAEYFELHMRALVALTLGRPVETFAEIADFVARLDEAR